MLSVDDTAQKNGKPLLKKLSFYSGASNDIDGKLSGRKN